jgi:hypothetical protein
MLLKGSVGDNPRPSEDMSGSDQPAHDIRLSSDCLFCCLTSPMCPVLPSLPQAHGERGHDPVIPIAHRLHKDCSAQGFTQQASILPFIGEVQGSLISSTASVPHSRKWDALPHALNAQDEKLAMGWRQCRYNSQTDAV